MKKKRRRKKVPMTTMSKVLDSKLTNNKKETVRDTNFISFICACEEKEREKTKAEHFE